MSTREVVDVLGADFEGLLVSALLDRLVAGLRVPVRRLGPYAFSVDGRLVVSMRRGKLTVEWQEGYSDWAEARRLGLYGYVTVDVADPTLVETVERLIREHVT